MDLYSFFCITHLCGCSSLSVVNLILVPAVRHFRGRVTESGHSTVGLSQVYNCSIKCYLYFQVPVSTQRDYNGSGAGCFLIFFLHQSCLSCFFILLASLLGKHQSWQFQTLWIARWCWWLLLVVNILDLMCVLVHFSVIARVKQTVSYPHYFLPPCLLTWTLRTELYGA